MIAPLLLLLPILGIVLFDPVCPDWFAVKEFVLLATAAAALALAIPRRRLVWSRVDTALWIFVAVRGVMLLLSPRPGNELRWWLVLLGLAAAHQVAVCTRDRRWLRQRAPRALAILAGLVSLGRGCFMVSQSGISGSTQVGHGVTLAGQAGVAGHVKVGDGAVIGAQAGVHADVRPGGQMLGTPALEGALAKRSIVLIRRLPEMSKRIRELERRLEKLEQG